MKLNIITGLLFALLLCSGISTKAIAQGCCRWHHYHYGCCGHMDAKDKDKDKEEMNDKDSDKDKDGCQSCCYHHCHSWPYVAPKHCSHHDSKCCYHYAHHCCGHDYYYRGGGR